MGQFGNGKSPGHEGVDHRFALIGQGLNEDEDENRHARSLGTKAVFAAKIEKISLMHDQAKAEMMEKVLVSIEVSRRAQ